MKKLIITLLAICLTFSLATAAPSAALAAESDSTVILFEGAEQSDGTVKIDVSVKENSGVYSMLLSLDYDNAALSLTSVEYGEALSSLDPLSSGDYSTLPYRISYLGTDGRNDVSTGRMLTLTFSVKENAPDGKYTVTFGYGKNRDVTYLSDGAVKTKNLVIEGTEITLKNSGIESVRSESGEEGSLSVAAICWIIAGSVVGAGAIALITVLIIKKKKRRWVKL